MRFRRGGRVSLFSVTPYFKRQEAVAATGLVYSRELSPVFKSQFVMLWREEVYNKADEVLLPVRFFLGLPVLTQRTIFDQGLGINRYFSCRDSAVELVNYFLSEIDNDVALTIIEYVCIANVNAKTFIGNVNYIFKLNGIGFCFEKNKNSGFIRYVEDDRFSEECTQKCFSVLGVPEYSDVLMHYINAFEEVKNRKYDDALIDLRQAIESLLKTRFRENSIDYDKRDTYAKLLTIAQNHVESGVYDFQKIKDMIQSVGSASNAGGHGQPQGQALNVDEIYVRFMINQAAANLLFLAEVPLKP